MTNDNRAEIFRTPKTFPLTEAALRDARFKSGGTADAAT